MELDRGSARRSMLLLGLVLVVVGGLALGGRAFGVDLLALGWPLFVLVPGIGLFVAALAVGGRGGVALAIPGGIVTMAGFVLAFQSATSLWGTWSYAWALVAPGGVGLAITLYGLLTNQREFLMGGLPMLLVSLGLFLGFGLFFEGVLHISGPAAVGMETVFAAGLVLIGVLVLVWGLLGRRMSPWPWT